MVQLTRTLRCFKVFISSTIHDFESEIRSIYFKFSMFKLIITCSREVNDEK